MRTLTALNIAVGVFAAIGIAAIAPPAYADGINPYLPTPAASTETADHGQGTYCTIRPLGSIWSCEAPKLIGGEGPDRMGFEARVSRANPDPKPTKDDCDHGPKGEGGGGGSPDGAGRSSVRS